MRNITFYTLFLLVSFSSCATQNIFDKESKGNSNEYNQEYLDILQDTSYTYTIRQDDKISISVWGHDDLSVGSTYGIYNSNEVYGKWLMVDKNGTIEVPRIGTLYVKNSSIVSLKKQLKDSLSKILVNPIVDVKILNREISLMGEFRDPASVPVDKETNFLLDMISKVGGFDTYANLSCIKVFRQKGQDCQVITVDLTEKGNYLFRNIPLYPGDIVIAPSRSYKEFDRRVSTIIPFTSALTSAAIFVSAF